MVWLPSTAVGEGDEPGGEDVPEVATELAAAAGWVGDPGCAAEDDAADAAVVAVGSAVCATAADGFAEPGGGLGLA